MDLPGYIRRSGYMQGMFILLVLVLGIMGWGWLMRVTVDRIDVHGATNAEPDEIVELAGVDTGNVMFQVSPRLVVDRVSRHPWVAGANVTRLPTGVLTITVRERIPVLQVLLSDGRPGHYLDADGYQMPPSHSSAYDVPLLSGFEEDFHPVAKIDDAGLREFVEALEVNRKRAGILISEVIVTQDEFWLRLEPSQMQGSTPVRLGHDDFENKLGRLADFWDQRIARHPDRTFELIDLRFSSQVIAREKGR